MLFRSIMAGKLGVEPRKVDLLCAFLTENLADNIFSFWHEIVMLLVVQNLILTGNIFSLFKKDF